MDRPSFDRSQHPGHPESVGFAGQPARHERALAAEAALRAGEAFMLERPHDAHRARRCFELAARLYDAAGDLAAAAKARVSLANALLALRDPSARAVLEDAGELFEELGDERSVLAIDLAIRQAQAEFEESPRSFHARPSVMARA